MPGAATLEAEVTHISANGFWVLLGDEELPVPFSEFPWFRTATVVQIATLERPIVNHLYWPLLDIDPARLQGDGLTDSDGQQAVPQGRGRRGGVGS